jgi:hypothetical protein
MEGALWTSWESPTRSQSLSRPCEARIVIDFTASGTDPLAMIVIAQTTVGEGEEVEFLSAQAAMAQLPSKRRS